MAKEQFLGRHVGPRPEDVEEMLKVIGVKSVDELIEQTVPASIRLQELLDLPAPLTEDEFLARIRAVAAKNKLYRSFIGQGYYDTISPAVIIRNILENPAWYTSYTPYQAEVSQGRLEALLNYQTMIIELTAMEITNCSLLDEATAAAEAMTMMYALRGKEMKKAGANKLFVDNKVFPQIKDVLVTRSAPQGIELVYGDYDTFEFTPEIFGALVQYPAANCDPGLQSFCRSGTCQWFSFDCCRRFDEFGIIDSSRRVGGRCGCRYFAAVRYPDGIRWSSCCLHGY